MRKWVFPVLLLCAVLLPMGQISAGDREAAKAKRLKASVGAAVGAYRRGDPGGLIRSLSPVLAQLDEVTLSRFNEALRKSGSPTIPQMLAEARLTTSMKRRRVPKPRGEETALVLPTYRVAVLQARATLDKSRALTTKITTPELKDYDKIFLQLESLQAQAAFGAIVAEFAHQLKTNVKRPDGTSLTPEQAEAYNEDFAARRDELKAIDKQLSERILELRIERLKVARRMLEGDPDLKRRIVAAGFLDQDGEQLTAFLEQLREGQRRLFTSPLLSSPDIAQQVEQDLTKGRQLAGGLIEKGRLLSAGVTWWLRGRYGLGPLANGLAKPPVAKSSPAGVFMPPLQKPTNPKDGASQSFPQHQRRHHSIWAWEERSVQYNAVSRTERTVVVSNPQRSLYSLMSRGFAGNITSSQTKFVNSMNAKVVNKDAFAAPRLVGFVEYGLALANFDRLVGSCNQQELNAINELVAERDELAIYTNLSRFVVRGPSTLKEAERAGDEFERRGLHWMTALARVELGAMYAGFSDHRSPFSVLPPSAFDKDAYNELVLDGARVHFWALANDPTVANLFQGPPSRSTLATTRRLYIARGLANASLSYISAALNPPQRAELVSMQKRLNEMNGMLMLQLALYDKGKTTSGAVSGAASAAGRLRGAVELREGNTLIQRDTQFGRTRR